MFFVRSAEKVPCPCCQGALGCIGSRRRTRIQASGEVSCLIIRRLHCGDCKRVHHELPDILVPYKRYDADSIERVVAGTGATDVAADDATLSRWRHWFSAWLVYALGCLASIAIRFNLPVKDSSVPSPSALQAIGRFVGEAAGWLARVVRPIANSNRWVTDPFCVPVRLPLR